jgi:radical SAM superfamily enzyme YgiQ (UPF0313 family)
MAGRAVFVVPPVGFYVREERCQGSTTGLAIHTLRPPLDLAQDAAILEAAGWFAAIVDAPAEGLSQPAVLARIAALRPDLVCTQATVPTLDADVAFLAAVKADNPGATIVARGASFGLDPCGALRRFPALDVVVFHEADAAFVAFARQGSWNGVPGAAWRVDGVVASAPPVPAVLDDLPRPARHLLKNELYTRADTGTPQTTLVTARGCPFGCSYCLASLENGTTVRRRSPASIRAEVEDCHRRFGIRDFLFLADTFTLDGAWVETLCRELIATGLPIRWVCNSRVDCLDEARVAWMRRAGCWGVSLGIESGDDDTLRRIGKGTRVDQARAATALLRRHGILSLGYLMIGFPWEDEARIRRGFEGFLDIDPDLAEILFPYPFPGTRIREDMIGAGVLAPDATPGDACARPAAPTPTVSVERLVALRAELLRRFVLRPRFLARMARRIADPRVLAQGIRMGWRLARDRLGARG